MIAINIILIKRRPKQSRGALGGKPGRNFVGSIESQVESPSESESLMLDVRLPLASHGLVSGVSCPESRRIDSKQHKQSQNDQNVLRSPLSRRCITRSHQQYFYTGIYFWSIAYERIRLLSYVIIITAL